METCGENPIAAYRAKHALTLSAFGALIGVQKSVVSKWENGQQKPSVENAAAIERATNGELRRHDLRPDVWDAPRVEAAE